MSRNCGCELCASNRSTLGPTGENAHVEGFLTIAKGFASHAEGMGCCDINATLSDCAGEPIKDMSGRVGAVFNSACADGSHAANCCTVAAGLHSISLGCGTQAVGSAAHAHGVGTKASGPGATAYGLLTLAQGKHSLSYGRETAALGDYSTATGCFTCALGPHSYTSGVDSIARNMGQQTVSNGKFECKSDNQCSRFIVRNEIPPDCEDRLYLDGDFEQITVPCNSTWKVDVTCLARSISTKAPWCCFQMQGVIEIDPHGNINQTCTKEQFMCDDCPSGLCKCVCDKSANAVDVFTNEKNWKTGFTADHLNLTLNFEYDKDLDEHILYLFAENNSADYESDIDPEPYRFFAHVNTFELSVTQKKCTKKCGCLKQMQKPCDACC